MTDVISFGLNGGYPGEAMAFQGTGRRDSDTERTRATPRRQAVGGWSWWLAAVITAGLVFLALSGLFFYLGPFSVFSQLLLLVHTAVGLLLVVFLPYYLWRHFRAWWRQKVTAEMVLGYLLTAGVLVALVSGLVNAFHGAVGPGLAPLWDLTHLVAGLAVVALVAAHLVLAFLRRRPMAARDPELRLAMNSLPRRSLVALVTATAGIVAVALLWPKDDGRRPVPADYRLPTYAQQFDEYRGNPFAPTYARTVDSQFVEPRLLANSASCGSAGCHETVLAEWQPSAHRFAAMNPPFQAVQRLFAAERDVAETRYCAGCHDPISLFAGAKDMSHQDLSAPGVDEGISCVACHAISEVDQRGNADYVLTPPAKYLGELERGWRKQVGDFLIRTYPRQHLADYDRNLLRTAEFCGACHKQFIPEALNRFGLVSGQNQYDEWKNSRWHSEDPDQDLACRDCHMRLVYDSTDPAHGEGGDRRRSTTDGAHRHHGFIATNNFMPAALKLPHWEEQVRLTEEWVRGETMLPEIADLWPEGPVVGLRLQAPKQAEPGDEIQFQALITNRKAGHNFITGPLDFIRSWIHLEVRDATGALLAEWGTIDPETRRILDQAGREHEIGGSRDSGTLVLESLPVDETGAVLKRHELWKKAGGKGTRVVFPTYTDSHRYRLTLPAEVHGPLTVVARLNYRRYRQEFLELVVPELERSTGVYQPTITQAETRAVIQIGSSLADSPHPTDAQPGQR